MAIGGRIERMAHACLPCEHEPEVRYVYGPPLSGGMAERVPKRWDAKGEVK